jgi:ABC-type transport system involved in multi-copper enzyme maturation permease subunit
MANPVLIKDLRGNLFRRKPVLAVALMALAILVCTFGALFLLPVSVSYSRVTPLWRLPDLLLPVIAPAFAAGAFAKEYEQRTWQDLVLTRLTAPEILRGKFFACLLPTLIAIIVLFPALALILILQNVQWAMQPGIWMVVIALKFVISTTFYVSVVLVCSYWSASTRTSLVVSYIALAGYGLFNYVLWTFALLPVFYPEDRNIFTKPDLMTVTASSALAVSSQEFNLSPVDWLHLTQSIVLTILALIYLSSRLLRKRTAYQGV